MGGLIATTTDATSFTVLFVVDAMIGQDAVTTAKAFNERLDFDGVILTKLDGDTRGVHPDASDDAMVVEAVRDAAEGISAREFTPRPSWACRSCDFALICPAIDR